MDPITIISFAVGIAGLVGTIHFGLKSTNLQRRLRRFEWGDVEVGVKYLAKEVGDRFKPDLIFTISAPGGIVSNLFVTYRQELTPVYIGITLKKGDSRSLAFATDHFVLSTSKWRIAVPESLLRHHDKKILILDGSVVTGDALTNLVSLLEQRGFQRENILTAALITTEVACRSDKGPDVYWLRVPDFDLYLPWGHMMGPGY